MADPLYELLAPYFDQPSHTTPVPLQNDSTTTQYLNRLTTLSLSALTTTEPQSLSSASQSVLRNLQALSKRSHGSIITATDHLSHLTSILPELTTQSRDLRDGIPALESAATDFASKYDRTSDNAVLDRRKRAMLLSRNVDRVGDILDLPTLLASTISSSSSTATQGASSGTAASGFASALDLHAHVKRLKTLYPESALIEDITRQSDEEIQNLITVLITGLQSPGLKLAPAMRMIGWLRRVAPELTTDYAIANANARGVPGSSMAVNAAIGEGSLGALFLVCRLATLRRMLEALDPLRELADQESYRREALSKNQRWTGGAQTERFLKRYIEVFREQSFAIVQMYKSIFPSALPVPGFTNPETTFSPATWPQQDPKSASNGTVADAISQNGLDDADEGISAIPSALATFASHLVDMLYVTLRIYMPNTSERSSRDSLLTQTLYCAGSLGRLGADFGMMLALLEDDLRGEEELDAQTESEENHAEWVQVMKKHRVQASRLELLAGGVGSGRKASTVPNAEVRPPPPSA